MNQSAAQPYRGEPSACSRWKPGMSNQQVPPKGRQRAESSAADDAAAAEGRGACDIWGRPVAYDETAGEEEARMLMSLNWVCDLLDHMSRNPDDDARLRPQCDEFIRRLSAGARSPRLRKGLADAATCIDSGRYQEASAILRAVAV